MEREELLRRVKETIHRVEPGAEIILYGSRARGDARPDSDWDFLVLVDRPVDVPRTDRVRHALYRIEWDCGEIISSIVLNKSDWSGEDWHFAPLKSDVEHEGVTV